MGAPSIPPQLTDEELKLLTLGYAPDPDPGIEGEAVLLLDGKPLKDPEEARPDAK
ncbi:MAG: hypothetical protein V4662_12045 [Verrucomicrobiota bacterium]